MSWRGTVGVGGATGHKGAEMGKRLRTHLLLMAITDNGPSTRMAATL
jgi:hypothetical protein